MQFEVSLLKFLPNDDSKVFASHLPNPLLRTSMQIVHIRDGVDLKTEKKMLHPLQKRTVQSVVPTG